MDGLVSKKVMNKYEIKSLIGCGTYGRVHLVKLNGHHYALKEINLNNLNPVEKQRAFKEVSLLAKLNHRFIIKYRDSSLDHISGRLYIITDYADCGDLSTAIKRQGRSRTPFNTERVLFWFVQISLALQYIHSQKVLHRDLKTTNIFLCQDNTVKVGDFGIAKELSNSQDLAVTGVGTPYYMSPEICLRKPYNTKSDMWALGCVLFEISALKFPFEADNFPQLMSLILEGKRRTLPGWCSALEKQLVDELLSLDPDKRPSTGEILAYPSLQYYLSFYEEKRKKTSPLSGGKSSQIPEGSCKRNETSASTASSNCSKASLLKFSPRTSEEKKPLSTSTRVLIPSIVVTDYGTQGKIMEKEKKPRSLSIRVTTSVGIDYERKPRSASNQVIPPSVSVINCKTEKNSMQNDRRSRTASTVTIPSATFTINGKGNKFEEPGGIHDPRRRKAISMSPPKNKTANKVLNASPLVGVDASYKTKDKYEEYASNTIHSSSENAIGHSFNKNKTADKVFHYEVFWKGHEREVMHNTAFIARNETSSDKRKNSSEMLTPNDIDCGYSSEEINYSADSAENSICEHSISNSLNECSILKGTENDEVSIDQSHCQHSQCQQCLIDMMWKNRIRSCVDVSKDNRHYLKLKKKLFLSFGPNLFLKVYKSLRCKWEGSENGQSKAPFQNFVKLLNYEQFQNLPLMMQLVQLDMMGLSSDGTSLQSDQLVML